MPLTNFVAKTSVITSAWLNKIDALYVNIFGEATTANAALTTLTATRAEAGAVAVPVLAKLRESISVKDFGAVGDGVADDTAAIQAAIDAAGAGDVWMPKGNYKITAKLKLPSGCRLRGAGISATTITATIGSAMISSTNPATRFYYIKVQDMTLDNTNRATAGGIGIDFKNISLGAINQVEVKNAETGILFDATGGGAYYNDLYSPQIATCGTGLKFQAGANENRVFGCRVVDTTTGVSIDDVTHVEFFGTAVEVFTTAFKIGPTAITQYTGIYGCRCENAPTSGTAFELGASAQSTVIINPQIAGVTTQFSGTGSDTVLISGDYAGFRNKFDRVLLGDAGTTSLYAMLYADGTKIFARNQVDNGYVDMEMRDLIPFGQIHIQATSAKIYGGTGTPEGIVTAQQGSIFARTNGGAGTSLYIKESGVGNTGWVGK